MGKRERFYFWLSWHLPRVLVYWCAIRVASYASTGLYHETYVPELRVIDALERWEVGK